MSLLDKLYGLMPFGKKEEVLEYLFSLNITSENLTAALWTIEGKHLKILETASDKYSSPQDLTEVTDKLLDQVLGIREIDVSKILFGVPSTWISDENLKDEYLKILRGLVKELELTPIAYVEGANALVHFLEKQEGIPPTAVLVGFEKKHLTVTVVRAGKLDGVKIISRSDNSGTDIEKVLLTFSAVETLPSKILIYGLGVKGLKSQLLSFSWMSKLSFLHFPKIDILKDDIDIKSVCFAGATEIQEDVYYTDSEIVHESKKAGVIIAEEDEISEKPEDKSVSESDEQSISEELDKSEEDLGFVVGDVASMEVKEEEKIPQEAELVVPEETSLAEIEDFDQEESKRRFSFKIPHFKIPQKLRNYPILLGILGLLLIILGAYLFLPKASVKIFVEPKILEKDAQVTADPNQKEINEDSKIIPGQNIETEVSGSSKGQASGKKQIGDPAKGTVSLYNKTNDSKSLSKGTILSLSNNLKFSLDISVSIASSSATDTGVTYGKISATVTASAVGADSNLPSGSELSVGGFSSSQISAKAEGNFSGGTSKDVTVVSDEDQKKLLASLASDLRRQAQQKLQEKLPGKKILEEALSENIIKKSYNKNINDQASEFSLNLTIDYKGVAFEDKDLKQIVGKLVTTQIPEGFELNLEDTETQADVSKLQKDGKLIFLARFKAKLLPKLDTNKIKEKLKGKTPSEVEKILKQMDNILGSEIKFSPSLPSILQRLPLLSRNITIEVGLK